MSELLAFMASHRSRFRLAALFGVRRRLGNYARAGGLALQSGGSHGGEKNCYEAVEVTVVKEKEPHPFLHEDTD